MTNNKRDWEEGFRKIFVFTYSDGIEVIYDDQIQNIINFISQVEDTARKEVLISLQNEVEELRHELGQEKSLDGDNESWKEGHTKSIEEVLSLIEKYKQ